VTDEPARDRGRGPVSQRPRIAAGVAAEILAAAPSRVRKRFDADTQMAQRWTWEPDGDAWAVRADAETVRIEPDVGTVRTAGQLSCSCLLGPRCVHLLAVAAALDLAEDQEAVGSSAEREPGEARPQRPEPGRPQPKPPQTTPVELSRRQRDAAVLAWRAGARLLTIGASAATATARGDLLLAAHACQEAGLHRLGAAAIRVATGIRDLAAGRPEFRLAGLAEDLAELLAVAWRLNERGGAASPADVGVGRRHYQPVGSLQLHGLASEAVAAASGYAGVVVWLVDQTGRLWTVPDVAPGQPARAAEAYRGPVRFGQLGLQHRELGRSRVIAQGATGSTDGRLGSGGGVTATRVGPSSWDDPPLTARWADPLEEQLERVWRALELPAGERPAGADLVFLDAIVLGLVPAGLALEASNARRPLDVLGVVPSEHAELAYLDNLRRLGGLAGHPLRLVGRVRPDRPRTVALLAAGGPALKLPATLAGRVNLGLDHLTGGHTAAATRDAARTQPASLAEGEQEAPLERLRRTALRATLGGRATLGAMAARALDADAARLRQAQFATAADLLDRLAQAGMETRRALTGERVPPPPDRLARAWTAAMVYQASAGRSLLRAGWET
jgi:SWIM zinc finger